MSSRFTIEAVYRAMDQMTNPLAKMTKAQKKFTNSIKTDFAQAQRQVGEMSKTFSSMIGPFAALFSVGAVLDFANKSIDKFRELEAATANVKAGLDSTKNAAGLSLEQITDMAEKLSANTIFGKKDIMQNATAQLLTFTNITGKNFERVQNVVADVTAKLYGVGATGESLHHISIMIGKMMENPIKGMAAARRIGISFSQSEEQVVKDMMAHNDVLGSQNYMLKIIEKQYGLTNKELIKTAAGMKILKQHKIDEAMERIGSKMTNVKGKITSMFVQALPLIEKFFDLVAKGFEILGNLTEKLSPFIQYIPAILAFASGWFIYEKALFAVAFAQSLFNKKINYTAMAIGILIFLIYSIIKNWSKLNKTQKILIISIGAIVSGLGALIGIIYAVRNAKLAWIAVQTMLNIALSANPIGLIIVGIAALIAIIILVIIYWKQIIPVVQSVYEKFKLVLLLFGPIGAVLLFTVEIIKSLAKHWDAITEKFKSGDILGGFLEIGKAILDGILSPIQAVFELLSHLPGLDFLGSAASGIAGFRAGVLDNKTITPTTPAERSTYSRSETTTKGEVTINDKSGMADYTKPVQGVKFQPSMLKSGSF